MLFANGVFAPSKIFDQGALTKMAKTTNVLCVLKNTGFAPQALENDENHKNGENGACHACMQGPCLTKTLFVRPRLR